MHPTLNVEHFPNDDDTEFRISNRMEMLSILQSIADHGARIALSYGDDQHFILTTLLGANERGMWLDIGPFLLENKRLLSSDKITFVSQSQRVKIQFVGCNIKADLLDNNQTYYLELPNYLLRIQRREFFRTAVATTRIKCIIPAQPENPDDPIVMRAVPIVDISGGGIGLLCEEHEATLVSNKTFPDCQISIPDVGILTVTIEVRNGINFTASDNVVRKRVGCCFTNLNNQMDILLQRYIAHMQSESMTRW